MMGSIQQKFAVTVFFCLLFAAGAGWIYLSMASAVRRADSDLAAVRTSIAALEQERRQARGFDRIIEERGGDLQRVEAFFVDRERPLEFIERLENLAKAAKSQIALEAEGPDSPGRLVFRVTLDGFEANIIAFLKLFELLPYEIQVEEFTLEKILGAKESDTRLTAQIAVRIK